jgi:hypothetical protein
MNSLNQGLATRSTAIVLFAILSGISATTATILPFLIQA